MITDTVQNKEQKVAGQLGREKITEWLGFSLAITCNLITKLA